MDGCFVMLSFKGWMVLEILIFGIRTEISHYIYIDSGKIRNKVSVFKRLHLAKLIKPKEKQCLINRNLTIC